MIRRRRMWKWWSLCWSGPCVLLAEAEMSTSVKLYQIQYCCENQAHFLMATVCHIVNMKVPTFLYEIYTHCLIIFCVYKKCFYQLLSHCVLYRSICITFVFWTRHSFAPMVSLLCICTFMYIHTTISISSMGLTLNWAERKIRPIQAVPQNLREGQKALQLGQPSNQALCRTLREAEPLACAASPIPLLLHSLSPSSLHIVLLPISLCVINYKRHKPPGLMPCHGRLPSCTFWRAKRLASLITPGTLSVSPFTGRRKSPRRALHRPKRHQRFLQSADGAYFSKPSAVVVFHFIWPCKTL